MKKMKAVCPVNPQHKDAEVVYKGGDGKTIGIRCPHLHYVSEAFGKKPQNEKPKRNVVFLISAEEESVAE